MKSHLKACSIIVTVEEEDASSALLDHNGPHPQYGWDFPEEIPEKFRKDPGNALRAFPGIPVESTAGIPQTLQLKAFEASRAFPEFSPPQYGWGGRFF